MEANNINERNFWFVLFSCGDTRTTLYGWLALDKSEYTKPQASKAGKRAATRKGENQFNYFVTGTSYVTDSPEAFKQKCVKTDINPNLSDYI